MGSHNLFNGMDDLIEGEVPCEECRNAFLVGSVEYRWCCAGEFTDFARQPDRREYLFIER